MYFALFSLPSHHKNFFWVYLGGLAGDEAAQQLYPFRAKICRTFELGGLTTAQDMQAEDSSKGLMVRAQYLKKPLP